MARGDYLRGKTYEEVFGNKEAKRLKDTHSKSHEGKPTWNKGLNKEEDIRIKKYSKKLELLIGEKHPHFGTKHTFKTKILMSLASKGKSKSKEHIDSLKNNHWSKKNKKNEIISKILKHRILQKPNKPEKIMIEIIKENNIPFNYVGNGQITIGGFNPDFLSKNPKHIIEVFGDYWHNLPKSKEKDKRRLETYYKYGYKTLIIWEHELKNKNNVLNKIKEFIK